MKTTKNQIINDLRQLIDFSCEDSKQPNLLELFHKMLIRMSYKAVDVNIDYDRKRIYMNVLAEDESYDMVPVNAFAPTMRVNLDYTDLNTFLKSCILEDCENLKQYYPFLTSCFYKFYKRTPAKTTFYILFSQALQANNINVTSFRNSIKKPKSFKDFGFKFLGN